MSASVPIHHLWSRLREAAKFTRVKEKGLALQIHEALDGAQNDRVVAARVAVVNSAFDIRDASLEERGPIQSLLPARAFKLVLAAAGEPEREIFLGGCENIHRKRSSLGECGPARRRIRNAPQDQWRIERYGCKRVTRDADETAVFRRGRNNSDTGRKLTQHLTQTAPGRVVLAGLLALGERRAFIFRVVYGHRTAA